jgi:hypothetical protein
MVKAFKAMVGNSETISGSDKIKTMEYDAYANQVKNLLDDYMRADNEEKLGAVGGWAK